jgi:hypothetical protein
VLAAFLGLIPGVGAMYNGQFIKGLIHLVIFAVLVSAAHVYGVFGIFVAGWIFYQVFEAYHTAKARRDGEPLPDPLGLNEVGNWFSSGGRAQQGTQPGPQTGTQAGAGTGSAGPAGGYQAENQAPYQAPYQAPNQGAYAPPAYTGPGIPPVPPVPPLPPAHWRHREPVGAVILIVLGLLFLAGQLNWFSFRLIRFGWPVLLIGLGVWLIVRRMRDTPRSSQGGQK